MKRNALMVLLIIALVALMAGGTYAWFTARDDAANTLTAGTVEIEINENYVPVTEWKPGNMTPKEVWVKTVGTKCVYVRVSITPVWEDPSLPIDNVILNWNEGNWVYSEGWYYYKDILCPDDEKTELLLQSVTLSDATDDRYQGKVLQIVVNAEAVQASHEAYKDAWGLTELPAGVQAWPAP